MSTTTFSKQAPAGIVVVPERKYGVFRVADEPGAITKILSRFKPIAEGLDHWSLSGRVDALRRLPEFSEMRSRIRETRVTLEIAGYVARGEPREISVIMVTPSGAWLAAARWVKGQGEFFQPMLSDKPEPVEAVLAPVEAKFRQAHK